MKQTKPQMKPLSVRFDRALINELADNIVEITGESRSKVIRDALEYGLIKMEFKLIEQELKKYVSE